ncbi:MAG TPA: class I SAM-dependent methyltransferase [Chitinophagaceae bacterium]|nr:class I SAM-dependent methyltransferase [Chitinophagaceae bacterium]
MNSANKLNEQQASLAFSRQAIHFDELYEKNTIIRYKRDRVRRHILDFLPDHASILELNSGTGEDAIWLARQGHHVHATDIAPGMQEKLKQKVIAAALEGQVTSELRSFTELDQLNNKGPYDHIFSNFAGLNCTNEMEKVVSSFPSLLKENGLVTLVLLPKFCLWESSLLLRGRFKSATRRMFAKNGRTARVEGEYFKCWYYNPSDIIAFSKKEFEVLRIEGLCTFVPPSYIEGFAEKHPGLYRRLVGLEEKWKTAWPWRAIGDYYIVTLRRK